MTPEYIDEHWTDEQFERFWQARNRRVATVNELVQQDPQQQQRQSPGTVKRVSDVEMFSMMGIGEA